VVVKPRRVQRAAPLMLPASMPPEANGAAPTGFEEF
jgi:hypothetical protein